MPIRYLLDENIPMALRASLLRRQPDLVVWRVGDPGAPPRGTLDVRILDWCETNRFLLVTRNRASMPHHLADHLAAGRNVPGILALAQDAAIGETLDELLLIAGASDEDEYRDQIVYLPLT